jgi:glycosyltransferase involved in cell wall biosynthesis
VTIQRCLFAIPSLPRPVVSADSVLQGHEALSGTFGSAVLIAQSLARRGLPIGVCVLGGQRLVEFAGQEFQTLTAAAGWLGNGLSVWVGHGDDASLAKLLAAGLWPILWTHVHVSPVNRMWLEKGMIAGLITVSDTVRLSMLRSRKHRLVGRVYNPLSPVFAPGSADDLSRFGRRRIAYAGAAGYTKGLHRVLEMWPSVHRAEPDARLVIAGTGRLYGENRELGPFGIAEAGFERRYVAPIAQEFGSLPAAGIEIAGLLTPRELCALYTEASLGIVNPNWSEYTESFCCAATEMLATGLPVFSVARGALPETIGHSGGAFLTREKDSVRAAGQLIALIRDPQRLARLGAAGRGYVAGKYSCEKITESWANLIEGPDDLEGLCDPWQGPRTPHYVAEFVAGRVSAGWMLDAAARTIRLLKRQR